MNINAPRAPRRPAFNELAAIREEEADTEADRILAALGTLRNPPRGELPGEKWQDQMLADRLYTEGWRDALKRFAGDDSVTLAWGCNKSYRLGWDDAENAITAGRATRALPTTPHPQPTTPAPATATPEHAPSLAWSLPPAPRATRIPTPPTDADQAMRAFPL